MLFTNFKTAKKMTFQLNEFRDISSSDKLQICQKIISSPSDSCERNFANLFMWHKMYKTQIANFNDNILIYFKANNVLMFPLGKEPSPRELFEISKSFDDILIYDVPPLYAQKNFVELSNYFYIGEDENEFDYIYNLNNLINLKGALLRKKHNLIRQFDKNYPNSYTQTLNAQNIELAFNFMLGINRKRENFIEGLKNEDDALICAKENFDFLGLKGLLLFAQRDTLVGVSVFSEINPQIYTIHFEKSEFNFKGASQKLVWLEANEIKKLGAERMNREQDLGIENLRQAKKSLNPVDIYRRIFLKKKRNKTE